jgi:thioredoxin-like negative regulator of GroEL
MSFFPSKAVRQLTDVDFVNGVPRNVSADEPMLVLFYAPWCPHCTRMKDAWASLAESARGFTVAALDADKYHLVSENAGIEGFPTIRLYTGGRAFKTYEGDRRDVESLARFALGNSSYFAKDPLVHEFPDSGKLKGRIQNSGKTRAPLLVMYYAPWCPHCKNMRSTWSRVANAMGSNVQVAAFNCERDRSVPIRSFPTIALYNGGVPHIYRGNDRSPAAVTAFVCKTIGGCS